MSFFAQEEWTVTVNYGLSFDEMVAAGYFRSVDRNYSASAFPVKGEGMSSVRLRLMCLEVKTGDVSTQTVLDSMDSYAVRPARLEELLALAASDPDILLKRRVFALGSRWHDADGLIYVPECNFAERRRLHLYPIRREPWWCPRDDCFACIPL
jgi:hypothetical protein